MGTQPGWGGDSQVTCGYTKNTLKFTRKIWKPKRELEVVVGVVGSLRDIDMPVKISWWK